jgi:hypothetical protein
MDENITGFINSEPAYRWLQKTFGEANVSDRLKEINGNDYFRVFTDRWPIGKIAASAEQIVEKLKDADIMSGYYPEDVYHSRRGCIYISLKHLSAHLAKAGQALGFPLEHNVTYLPERPLTKRVGIKDAEHAKHHADVIALDPFRRR